MSDALKPFDQPKNTCGWNDPILVKDLRIHISTMSLSKAWNTGIPSKRLGTSFQGFELKRDSTHPPNPFRTSFFSKPMWTFRNFLGAKTHIFLGLFGWRKSLSSREAFQMFHQLQRCILILPWTKVENVNVIFKKSPPGKSKNRSQTNQKSWLAELQNNSFSFWQLFQMLSLSWKVWGLYLDDVLGVSLWITHSTIVKLVPQPYNCRALINKNVMFLFHHQEVVHHSKQNFLASEYIEKLKGWVSEVLLLQPPNLLMLKWWYVNPNSLQ